MQSQVMAEFPGFTSGFKGRCENAHTGASHFCGAKQDIV